MIWMSVSGALVMKTCAHTSTNSQSHYFESLLKSVSSHLDRTRQSDIEKVKTNQFFCACCVLFLSFPIQGSEAEFSRASVFSVGREGNRIAAKCAERICYKKHSYRLLSRSEKDQGLVFRISSSSTLNENIY